MRGPGPQLPGLLPSHQRGGPGHCSSGRAGGVPGHERPGHRPSCSARLPQPRSKGRSAGACRPLSAGSVGCAAHLHGGSKESGTPEAAQHACTHSTLRQYFHPVSNSCCCGLFVSFLGKNAHKLFDTESESCSLSGEQCLHWRRSPRFCGPWPGAGPEQPGIRVQPLFCLRAWASLVAGQGGWGQPAAWEGVTRRLAQLGLAGPAGAA